MYILKDVEGLDAAPRSRVDFQRSGARTWPQGNVVGLFGKTPWPDVTMGWKQVAGTRNRTATATQWRVSGPAVLLCMARILEHRKHWL